MVKLDQDLEEIHNSPKTKLQTKNWNIKRVINGVANTMNPAKNVKYTGNPHNKNTTIPGNHIHITYNPLGELKKRG